MTEFRTPEARARNLAWKRWDHMVRRCTNPDDRDWHNYGGRGITVCAEWRDFGTYYRDVGDPPRSGLTLDRIDNDRGYELGNVRWATRVEQNLNRRNAEALRVHCAQGHPYDETNTYLYANGWRQCRTCQRELARRRHRESTLAARGAR